MDHLPEIKGPAYPAPNVPCLCQPQDYDGQGIVGFVERVGWKIDREKGPECVDAKKSQICSSGALLQAWLYFGMLHDVLQISGLKFDLSEHVRIVEGKSLVTSDPLKTHLDRLMENAPALPQDERQDRRRVVRGCLKTVLGMLELHWNQEYAMGMWRIEDFLSLEILVSLEILAETFKDTLREIWRIKSGSQPLSEIYSRHLQNPLKPRLIKNGWCPNEAALLCNSLDTTGVHLASLMRRPFADTLTHTSCSEEACLALQTSESDYQTIHPDECLGKSPRKCNNIFIDQDKIVAILAGGGIPIIYISFIPEDDRPPKVMILDFNSNRIEYVAFSHVWAHGLGNPKENALPSCQISRLRILSASLPARRFYQTGFWIDTLCIPVARKHKACRKLAIGRLGATFRDSCRVLVLDADLQRISQRCSRLELATRILTSGWMRRLWTLQEAVISGDQANATRVDVQFLEGAEEFNAVLCRPLTSRHHSEAAVASVLGGLPQYLTPNQTFGFLARGLRYRSTSRREDEAPCMASILGFDSIDQSLVLNETTAETRMQQMYTLMSQIPGSVLFNRSKKLGTNCFQWAPASLLGSIVTDVIDGPMARCDQLGLHVQFPGYLINCLPALHTGSLYIGDRQNKLPTAIVSRADEELESLKVKQESDHKIITFDQMVQLSGDKVTAFDQRMRGASKPAIILNPRDPHESVLLSREMRERGDARTGELYAAYVSRIFVRFWRIPTCDPVAHSNWRDHLLDVQEVPSDQWWCIR